MKALAYVWLEKLASSELDALVYAHPRDEELVDEAADVLERCRVAVDACDPAEVEAAHEAWFAVPGGAA